MGAGVSEGDWERVPQLLFDCECECDCECESFSLWIRVFPAGRSLRAACSSWTFKCFLW